MTTSPFSTFEEFSSAKGPIYTFANNSSIINILLIIGALISIYFVYASYFMKQESMKAPGVKALGLLLLAGFASVMGTVLNPQWEQRDSTNSRQAQETRSGRQNWQPLAFLGMMGLGGTAMGRKAGTKRRSPRKLHRLR